MPKRAYQALGTLIRSHRPRIAIVLGSGLNRVADGWTSVCTLPFIQVPGLSPATVAGHRGVLGLHLVERWPLLVFHGRVHYYEGQSWDAVIRPVTLAASLGVRTLVFTNAAGGIGPRQVPGSLMVFRDHIVANRRNWWQSHLGVAAGAAQKCLYSVNLRWVMQETAASMGVELREGTYAGVTGPCYETPAEVRALRTLGADAVGMSTVREAETAAELGLEVLAISCIANRAAGLSDMPVTHADVLANVVDAGQKLGPLLTRALPRIAESL